MALILAIALGMFWAIKLYVEKSEVRQSKEEYQKVRDREEIDEKTWRSNVTNIELEMDIEDKLYHKDAELIGEYERTKEMFPESAYGSALRVLMANRGKIPYKDSEIGIAITASGNTQLEKEKSFAGQIQFVRWVSKRIKSDEVYYDSFGHIVPLDEARCECGYAKWRPMISEFQIKHSNR